MIKKFITQEVSVALEGLVETPIPPHLQMKALSLHIKEVYFFNSNLSNYGIYGNCVVLLNEGMYVDFQVIPNDIEALFQLLR